MSGYREYRFFSPALDSEAARLSMVDREGREYFTILSAGEGKTWRQDREVALARIEDAIAAGDPAGEVLGVPVSTVGAAAYRHTRHYGGDAGAPARKGHGTG